MTNFYYAVIDFVVGAYINKILAQFYVTFNWVLYRAPDIVETEAIYLNDWWKFEVLNRHSLLENRAKMHQSSTKCINAQMPSIFLMNIDEFVQNCIADPAQGNAKIEPQNSHIIFHFTDKQMVFIFVYFLF